MNSLEGNESSIDNDDKEYIEVNEDSPNNTPNAVETPRSKIVFGPMSSKSSSTSKHKNIGSVTSVVEEIMQQNADQQEKLLEMQKTTPTVLTIKGGQEEKSRDKQGKRNGPETTMT